MQRRVKDAFPQAKRVTGRGSYRSGNLITIHLSVGQKTKNHEFRHTSHECGILNCHNCDTLWDEV
jgi:hypothetical protein